jgi:hypothetical protein
MKSDQSNEEEEKLGRIEKRLNQLKRKTDPEKWFFYLLSS